MHQIPVIHGRETALLKHKLRKHETLHSTLNYQSIHSMPVLNSLKEYLSKEHGGDHPLLEDSFTYIVDFGCSCSCSPHREAFVKLVPLDKPITLHGVTGESTCTMGEP